MSRAFSPGGRRIHNRAGNIMSECNLTDMEKYSFLVHYSLRLNLEVRYQSIFIRPSGSGSDVVSNWLFLLLRTALFVCFFSYLDFARNASDLDFFRSPNGRYEDLFQIGLKLYKIRTFSLLCGAGQKRAGIFSSGVFSISRYTLCTRCDFVRCSHHLKPT